MWQIILLLAVTAIVISAVALGYVSRDLSKTGYANEAYIAANTWFQANPRFTITGQGMQHELTPYDTPPVVSNGNFGSVVSFTMKDSREKRNIIGFHNGNVIFNNTLLAQGPFIVKVGSGMVVFTWSARTGAKVHLQSDATVHLQLDAARHPLRWSIRAFRELIKANVIPPGLRNFESIMSILWLRS